MLERSPEPLVASERLDKQRRAEKEDRESARRDPQLNVPLRALSKREIFPDSANRLADRKKLGHYLREIYIAANC